LRVEASSTRVRLLLEAYAGEIPARSKVLDLGCGNGRISRAVATAYGCDDHGADIENLLEHDLQFHPIVAGVVAVEDQAFDVAMLNDVLHHVTRDRQPDVIRDALRVSRKVLVFEQYPTVLAKVLDVVMAYVVYGGREPLPLSHRGPQDWSSLITREVTRACRVKPVQCPALYPLRHFALVLQTPEGRGVLPTTAGEPLS
jgi:2-polyprenyl-3-methyl-5-hydroxy-6-metoxy-1,4-benzoquinol methylase